MRKLFFLWLLAITMHAHAQTDPCITDLMYKKNFASAGNDAVNAIVNVPAGGSIIAGNTTSSGFGGTDALLVRLNAKGDIIWQNSYGGNGNDNFRRVISTADGGFLAVGETASTNIGAGSNTEMFIVKTTSTGQLSWSKRMSFSGITTPDYCLDVIQTTSTPGYAFVGVEDANGGVSRAVTMMTDLNGNIIWGWRLAHSTFTNDSYSVIENGTSLVVVGSIRRGVQYELAIQGFAQATGVMAPTTILTINNITRGFFAPRISFQNGQYLISSHLINQAAYPQMYLGYLRLNTNFTVASASYLSHTNWRDDFGAGVLPLANGGILAYNSETTNSFVNTYEISALNTVVNTHRYGNGNEVVRSVIGEPNGGFFVTGNNTLNNDILLLKTNTTGNIPCTDITSDVTINALAVTSTGYTWTTSLTFTGFMNAITPQTTATTLAETIVCETDPCEDPCNITCLENNAWLLNGNNITLHPNSKLGTLNNADLKFITNNTQRALISSSGDLGIAVTNPTAKLHVDCISPVNASNVRFENLTGGGGRILVIDDNGYVKRSNFTIIYDPDKKSEIFTEQQKEIDELKRLVQELKSQQSQTFSHFGTNENKLYQSVPNPSSSGEIKIAYKVVASAKNAYIFITSAGGVQIRRFVVYPGEGQISMNSSLFTSAGEYMYTLVVDNKIIETKKLQILR